VSGFQLAALFMIGANIVWAAAHGYVEMMRAGRARLDEVRNAEFASVLPVTRFKSGPWAVNFKRRQELAAAV
jgi:hypothetical protein